MVAVGELPVRDRKTAKTNRPKIEVPTLIGIKNLERQSDMDSNMLHDSTELIQFAEQMMHVWEKPIVVLHKSDFMNTQSPRTPIAASK